MSYPPCSPHSQPLHLSDSLSCPWWLTEFQCVSFIYLFISTSTLGMRLASLCRKRSWHKSLWVCVFSCRWTDLPMYVVELLGCRLYGHAVRRHIASLASWQECIHTWKYIAHSSPSTSHYHTIDYTNLSLTNYAPSVQHIIPPPLPHTATSHLPLTIPPSLSQHTLSHLIHSLPVFT